MAYIYNSKQKKGKYHLIHEDSGLTYCKAENGSWTLDASAKSLPTDRQVCAMCAHLFKKGQPPTQKSKRQVNRESTRDFYSSDAWARLRYDLLKDATHCLCCGATKGEARLTVDHVKPIWNHPDLRLDPNNMQILCLLCNRGKGGRDETDFRELSDDSNVAYLKKESSQ